MSPSGSGLFRFEWSVLIFTFCTNTVSTAEILILLFINCSCFLKWMIQDVQGM